MTLLARGRRHIPVFELVFYMTGKETTVTSRLATLMSHFRTPRPTYQLQRQVENVGTEFNSVSKKRVLLTKIKPLRLPREKCQ